MLPNIVINRDGVYYYVRTHSKGLIDGWNMIYLIDYN